MSAVRERLPGADRAAAQGVTVEVGQYQAAIDVTLVLDYRIPGREVVAAARRDVTAAVVRFTALPVTLTVADLALPNEPPPHTDHLGALPSPPTPETTLEIR